jgi:hypothetical protein
LAYETLKDDGKRREYNRIYPSIYRCRPDPPKTENSRPPTASASATHSGAGSDDAQIAALQKDNEERNARWRVRQEGLNPPIFELQRSIRVLKQDISNLASVAAAEAAAETRKNSWSKWVLSPLYKQV